MRAEELLLLLFSLIFFNALCTSLAEQNFYIVLTDIKCTTNDKYAANFSCELYGGSSPAKGVNFEMQLKRKLVDYRIDLVIYLQRMKNYFLTFKAADIDVCVEFYKNITIPSVMLFMDMTHRAGKWPDCPVSENFYYKFVNITPNLEHLPPYLPKVGFKFLVIIKDKNEVVLHVTIFGKIMHKKPINRQRKKKN